MSGLDFDPAAARQAAAVCRAAAPWVDVRVPTDAVASAEVLVDASAELRAVQALNAHLMALHQDLLDHARELTDAATIVETHESWIGHLLHGGEGVVLGDLVGKLHLGGAERLLRLLGLGRPSARIELLPAGDEWSLGARSVADWLARGDRLADDQLAISVMADGTVVVVLPGIHSLGPTPDARDLPGAADELATGDSAYHEAVVHALQQLGLIDATLVLVGHSQGGIVAMDLARDPRIQALGTVTQVVTAGSPVDGIQVHVPVLELVNPDDGVPKLDGAKPRPGPLRTVITGHPGPVGPSHTMAGSPLSYSTLALMEVPPSDAPWLSGAPTVTTLVTALDGVSR